MLWASNWENCVSHRSLLDTVSAEFPLDLTFWSQNVSVPRCVERERVIGIAAIDEIAAAGAEHFLDPVDCLARDAGRLARLNLRLQLDEGPIGAVYAACQDRCDVEEYDRILHQWSGCTGNMKLRIFQRTDLCRVRPIQQCREFAEYLTGLRYFGDLDAFLDDCDRTFLQDQQPTGR